MRKPSLTSLLAGLIPLVAVCLSVPLWDRVYPLVFGLPFNLFWLVAWLVLTPVCMAVAYRADRADRAAARRDRARRGPP